MLKSTDDDDEFESFNSPKKLDKLFGSYVGEEFNVMASKKTKEQEREKLKEQNRLVEEYKINISSTDGIVIAQYQILKLECNKELDAEEDITL